METVPYFYARALEFEGRHPHDAGQWSITSMRLRYLEGLPTYLDDYQILVNKDQTIQNTPLSLRRTFWPNRIQFYRRIRSANEAASVIRLRGPDSLAKVCLQVFSGWIDPEKGLISMPKDGDVAAPETHAVRLEGDYRLRGVEINGDLAAKHFLFTNSWSPDWGMEGRGFLPFAYYDKYSFEQWSFYQQRRFICTQEKRSAQGWTTWQGRDEFDRRIYSFEAGAPDGERLGWAFAIETSKSLQVEELFVAPEQRGKGIGRKLARQLVHLSTAKSLPLRLWVSFADSLRESPSSAPALPKFAKLLGVRFHQCPVRWAAYFATSDHPGSEQPIEPLFFPNRPRSPHDALTRFFAALSLSAGGTASTIEPSPPDRPTIEKVIHNAQQDNSNLELKNARRLVLIQKKNREGLNDTEQSEFTALQQEVRSLVESTSPGWQLYAPEIKIILAKKTGLL